MNYVLVVVGLAGWFVAGMALWHVRRGPRRDPEREAYIRDLRATLRLIANLLLRIESKHRPLGSEEVMGRAESLLYKE